MLAQPGLELQPTVKCSSRSVGENQPLILTRLQVQCRTSGYVDDCASGPSFCQAELVSCVFIGLFDGRSAQRIMKLIEADVLPSLVKMMFSSGICQVWIALDEIPGLYSEAFRSTSLLLNLMDHRVATDSVPLQFFGNDRQLYAGRCNRIKKRPRVAETEFHFFLIVKVVAYPIDLGAGGASAVITYSKEAHGVSDICICINDGLI